MTDSGPNPAAADSQPRQSKLNDIRGAVLLLTRWPISGSPPALGQAAAAAWAFPLVGAAVGLLGGIVFLGANHAGLGIGSATLLTIAAQVLATGALHEDGLADTADGFGGGNDRERKLAIMRDSRIGSYGVIALILTFGLRYVAINEMANSLISTSDEYDQTVSHIGAVFIALVISGAVSRAAMAAVWYVLPAARTDGLAASAGTVPFQSMAVGVVLASAIAFLLLPVTGWAVLLGAVAAFTAAITILAKRQIGGHTGDVLGATQQLAEIVALLAIAATTAAI